MPWEEGTRVSLEEDGFPGRKAGMLERKVGALGVVVPQQEGGCQGSELFRAVICSALSSWEQEVLGPMPAPFLPSELEP